MGGSDKGFILTHRKIMDNPVWADPFYYKLWSYCLFKASYCDREVLIGNQVVKLERGQFITGRKSLAEDMNKGMKPEYKKNELTWYRHLQNLEKWQMLNIKSNNKYSVVTIGNYDFYQMNEQQTEQQNDNNRTTTEQQLNTNKELKELKKENIYVQIIDRLNEKTGSKFRPNTIKTKQVINARINEKYTLEDFYLVIDHFCEKWKGKKFSNGELGDDYLQPSTLFNNKFDERLNIARKGNQPKKEYTPTMAPTLF